MVDLFRSRPALSGRAVVGLLVWLVSANGCAAKEHEVQWESDILEARRIHDRGEYSTAETRYRELLESADSTEERRYVRLQLARLAADRGETEEAIERYREIWRKAIDDSAGARSMYEASRLVIEKLGRPGDGRSMKRRLIRRFPDSSWAERSIEDLVAYHARREAWEALQSEVDSLYEDVRETSVADHLLQTAGEVLWQDGGRADAALGYLHGVFERHPDGEAVDDAEWAAARIYMRYQNWEDALPVLRRLADRVNASWLIGTFNSPHASKARFALGRIHLLFLDDYAEAIDHFEQYLSDFPRNRRADDSAWHIAHAHRLAGETDAYRRALTRLVEDFPESRYVDSAREQLRLMP